jgi:hypothetical protein
VDTRQKQSNNGQVRVSIAIVSALLVLVSCERDSTSSAFASPSATIESLFRAYDVEKVPQDEIRRRLQARERFELVDENLFRSCFSDWQGEHDQGLGGFVFGQLVAAKDELSVDIEGDTARVHVTSAPSDLPPIVMRKQDEGWKIDLRESIPADIRQRLYEVYRRARRAERHAR